MIKKKGKRKRYLAKWTKDLPGLVAVGLVSDPAHGSDFHAFSEIQKFVAVDEVKQNVIGAVMIADLPIPRINRYTGEVYDIVFDAENIYNFKKEFHKNKLTNITNLQHDDSTRTYDVYMIDSWIVDDVNMDKSKLYKLKGITKGSWVAIYHIPDKEIYQKVLAKEITGFSIEAYYEEEELLEKFDNVQSKNNDIKMKKNKLSNMISKFVDDVLGQGAEEQTFKEYVLESGDTVNVDETTQMVSDADGNPFPEGDHKLQDGKILVVDANSLLVEIREAVVEEEAPLEATAQFNKIKSAVEKLNAKHPKLTDIFNSLYATYTLEDGREVNVSVVETNEVRVYNAETQSSELLEKGNYALKDGGEIVVGDEGKLESAPAITDPEEITSDDVTAELESAAVAFRNQISKIKEAHSAEIDKMKNDFEAYKVDANKKIELMKSVQAEKPLKDLNQSQVETVAQNEPWENFLNSFNKKHLKK